MIATMSPASYNFDETISTLRYANRAKCIKNKPTINEDPKDALLREFQEEITRLREQLDSLEGGEGEEGSQAGSKKTSKEKKKKSAKTKKTAVEGAPKTEQQLEEMQRQVDAEKRAVLDSDTMDEDERLKLLDELKKRAAEIAKEKEERDALANKLKELEKQLLVGDVNLLDKEAQQREKLARQAAELEEQRRKERELQRQLEESEGTKLQIEEEYNNLQEEAQAKTKKLKKLWTLLMNAKNEITDLEEEHQREREDLLDTIRAISREIKLCSLVINQFIPQEYMQVIESAATYDGSSETWIIDNVQNAGNNIRGKKSIASGKMNALKESARNILKHVGGKQENTDSMMLDDQSWTPLCVFPNVYLTYDDAKLTKKTNSNNASPSRNSTSARIRSARPSTAGRKPSMSRAPSGKSDRSASGNEAAPEARGLIAKPVRYA